MKIRNLPFDELNTKEKKIVKRHWKTCKRMSGECNRLHKNINDFWEAHREVDTDYGNYDGWKE